MMKRLALVLGLLVLPALAQDKPPEFKDLLELYNRNLNSREDRERNFGNPAQGRSAHILKYWQENGLELEKKLLENFLRTQKASTLSLYLAQRDDNNRWLEDALRLYCSDVKHKFPQLFASQYVKQDQMFKVGLAQDLNTHGM